MSRALPLSALLVAGVVQAIIAQSAPGGEPDATEPDAASAPWVARFADVPEPDAAAVGVARSSTARFGSGLDSDGPGCTSSGLVASAGSSIQHGALARSALLRFGSGLEGDVPACAPAARAVAIPCSLREASANAACLRFGSGLDDDAPVRGPSLLLQSGLEGLASRAAPPQAASADRFGSGLEDRAQLPASNVLLESGL
ncbi:MAG: hypothetical protein JW940_24445 [Polyangiaceae bacterium]|nr:hypothetical protein [Polyangiaceae bacterium]